MGGMEERGDCTLGDHKRIIVPPNCVTLEEKQGWRGKKRVVVKEIMNPDIEGWRPLIVMSNTKSGGKDGEIVMSQLRRLLNPIQVRERRCLMEAKRKRERGVAYNYYHQCYDSDCPVNR